MRHLYLLIGFCLLWLPVSAQVRLTDAQRAEQIRFIRQDTLPYSVTALPPEVNSPFSEYSPTLLDDSILLFTSMRADVEEDNDRLFETSWYCQLFQSKRNPDGSYEPAQALPSSINYRKTFNSNLSYNPTGSELIYSRCLRNGAGDLRCSLWQSFRDSKGWSKPKRLPAVINAENATTLQPCLISLPEYDVLYFVSDRKNGMGGLDIWYSIRKNGTFEVPVNAGPIINTEGNEITPFYDKLKDILYFSSNEHLGIGDYDIFYSEGALSQWGEVSNMGVPFNSPYNDFYFYPLADGRTGYFSSNRPHDAMTSEDTCCNDIFFYSRINTDTLPTPVSDTVTWQEKIAAVLPITLYFQNDQPNPKSLADTTQLDYPTLYNRYVAEIQTYITQSVSGMSGDTLIRGRREMSAFMRDSIAGGYGRLLTLVRHLREALLAGDTVELLISGYASPLHNSDYNLHLSNRRIVSLLNYLQVAEGRFFIPYLNGSLPGLRILTNPQGAVGPAFTTNDPRETVYGLRAAMERKIVISLPKD